MIVLNALSRPETVEKQLQSHSRDDVLIYLFLSTQWATPPHIYVCLYRVLQILSRKREEEKTVAVLGGHHPVSGDDAYLLLQHLLLQRTPFHLTLYNEDGGERLRVVRKEDVPPQ